jgi:hypothetical protein
VNQLDLLIEPGTITRERHGNMPSTLDLALSTPDLTPWVTSCKVVEKLKGSDHKPIATIVWVGSPVRTNPLPRRNFKRLDMEAVRAGAQWLYIPESLLNTQAIDDYVDYLVGFIQKLIEQTIPSRTPCS